MDEVRIMMTEGCRSGLLGFIPSSFAVCKETFASCHKRLRPWFYGVHTQRGMSSHSCCLDAAATGHGLISSFCPPFALRESELWVDQLRARNLQRASANMNVYYFITLNRAFQFSVKVCINVIFWIYSECTKSSLMTSALGCSRRVQDEHQSSKRVLEEEPASQCEMAALRLSVLLLYGGLQSVAGHMSQQKSESFPC